MVSTYSSESAKQIDSVKQSFDRDGAVVLKQIIPSETVEEFQEVVRDIINARLRSLGLAESPANFDESYRHLCKIDRTLGGEIYRTCRVTTPFLRILANPSLESIAATLMGTDRAAVVFPHCNLRIDSPNEANYALGWHQEYPYHLISRSAVVAWIPLIDLDDSMGPVHFIPGSHKRLHPVNLEENLEVAGNSTSLMKLSSLNVDESEKAAKSIALSAGDCLLFHTYLLHRSAHNHGSKARWTVQIRYGNLTDPEFVGRGFEFQRLNSPSLFAKLHPDFVVKGPKN